MAKYLHDYGVDMLCVDTVNQDTKDMDITDDAVWSRLKAKIQAGNFHFIFAGPPCRTFSVARQVRPGPPPLRDRQHPYGFPKAQARERGLTPNDLENIRVDNLLAVRTAEACSIMAGLGRGYAVETPARWGDRGEEAASMFDFVQFHDLHKQGAKIVEFDQCRYGADTTKPTQVLYQYARLDQLEKRCTHPPVRHQLPSGKEAWTAHPPCVGVKTKTGDYATKALSAYPGPLNKHIADIIHDSLIDVI